MLANERVKDRKLALCRLAFRLIPSLDTGEYGNRKGLCLLLDCGANEYFTAAWESIFTDYGAQFEVVNSVNISTPHPVRFQVEGCCGSRRNGLWDLNPSSESRIGGYSSHWIVDKNAPRARKTHIRLFH
ncbi:hypothetical protein TNCV_2110381 [Trichonephila clavipes]|nr:hypothetical protein TNCV_2110381 [Trichonephila clavipes]